MTAAEMTALLKGTYMSKLTVEERERLTVLASQSDDEIDFSDIPELQELPPGAVIGKLAIAGREALLREIEELKAALKGRTVSCVCGNENLLRNLLAVIHLDGGHYTEKHGISKSVEDAKDRYYRLLSEVEGLSRP